MFFSHDDVSCANQIFDQQGTTNFHRLDMAGTLNLMH